MLSTNQRPAQELTLTGLGTSNAIESVTNFPGELKKPGISTTLFANSPRGIGQWELANSKPHSDDSRLRASPRQGESEISLRAHIKKARAAIAELLKREQRAGDIQGHQIALAWLAENRKKYGGQWIALQGSELLATGTSAREVYARVRGVKPSPLILKIELEDLPFAGW